MFRRQWFPAQHCDRLVHLTFINLKQVFYTTNKQLITYINIFICNFFLFELKVKDKRLCMTFLMSLNCFRPLVDLIRSSRSTTVQVKAASAVEALATNNPYSQKRFLDLDAPKALIRLLKVKRNSKYCEIEYKHDWYELS